MNARSILQNAGRVAGALNVVALAAGWRLVLMLRRELARQERRERAAGLRRPVVAVCADYSRPEAVGLVVGNFGGSPAVEVSFAFSAPVEGPEGNVLSGLPLFEEGLPFLEPGGRIEFRWGPLPSLIKRLRENGPEGGIRVTTRYRDPAGDAHKAEWTVDPLLLEGAPLRAPRGADGSAADGGGAEPDAPKEAGARTGSPVRRRRG